ETRDDLAKGPTAAADAVEHEDRWILGGLAGGMDLDEDLRAVGPVELEASGLARLTIAGLHGDRTARDPPGRRSPRVRIRGSDSEPKAKPMRGGPPALGGTWSRRNEGVEAYSFRPRSSSAPSSSRSFTDGNFMISFRASFQAFWTIQESERSCRAASCWISLSISSGKYRLCLRLSDDAMARFREN